MFSYSKNISAAQLDEEFEIISSGIRKISLPQSFLQSIFFIISELFSNIKEHSLAKNATFKIELRNEHLLLLMADDGIGLRQSYLSKEIMSKSDQSAIELALSGLSTKDFKERGFGLYSIRRLTIALEGKFSLSSGKAKAEIEKNSIKFKNLQKGIKGVAVQIKSNIRPLDFYKYVE